MSEGRMDLLVFAPQAPPHGGVAAQAALLLSSGAFGRAFDMTVVRTNALRLAENPDRKRLDFRSLTGALRLALSTLAATIRTNCSAVYCIANGDLSFPWVLFCALFAARARRRPLILQVHASRNGFWEWQKQHPTSSMTRACLLRRAMGGAGDRLCAWLSRRAELVIHLTEGIDSHYRSLGWRPADLVLPNSTTIGEASDPQLRKPGSMLFLGRLSKEKGLFDLLDALSGPTLPGDWELNVAGAVPSGEDPGSIASAIAARGLQDRIVLHGLVSGSDKAALMRRCSLLIHPTHRDVFPMSVVEAMAYGQAVAAAAIGEIPSIPADGGWIELRPGDASSIRKALSELVADPGRVLRMGMANREKALRVYDVEGNSSRVVDLIQGCARKRGR